MFVIKYTRKQKCFELDILFVTYIYQVADSHPLKSQCVFDKRGGNSHSEGPPLCRIRQICYRDENRPPGREVLG